MCSEFRIRKKWRCAVDYLYVSCLKVGLDSHDCGVKVLRAGFATPEWTSSTQAFTGLASSFDGER
jgi:hypothetical protein